MRNSAWGLNFACRRTLTGTRVHARPLILIGLMSLASGACVTRQTVTLDVEESPAAVDRIAIREARSMQNQAMAAGAFDRAASIWTDDVTIRRALGESVNGKPEYVSLLKAASNGDSTVLFVREPTEVEISGNWPLAFETGVWTGRIGSMTGPVVIGGKYSAQWVKRDGKWLIRSETFVALTCSGIGCGYKAVP